MWLKTPTQLRFRLLDRWGVLVMAGDSAIKSGADAGRIAAELAKSMSGKGGGSRT